MSNYSFDVTLYGETQQFSPALSKGRVRLFYKGPNRNYTFITDTFADKLLSSLPYAPIVGKFENDDFTDHGRGEQLQVYGVVPENPNIAWEKHVDKDGIEREYACADVILWTARFPEANIITGKSHSMELWPKSIEGDWIYINGAKYFRFDEGAFLGLAALGDMTEPCFEGAAFYSLKESIDDFVKELNNYNKLNGGKKIMEYKFKLSDSQKENAIFDLINPNLEAGYVDALIFDVFDDYALCYSLENGKYFRAYYTKDDAENKVEITERVDAYVLDVNQAEFDILTKLRETTTYEAIEQSLNEYNQLLDNYKTLEEAANTVQSDFNTFKETVETEKAEFEEKISGLNTQISELQEANSTYKLENETLKTEKEELTNYQVTNENNKKENYLNKFSARLPKEILEDLKSKLKEFSTEDFKKEVSFEVMNANEEALFSEQKQVYVPQDNYLEEPKYDGADSLLSKYIKNKKNN